MTDAPLKILWFTTEPDPVSEALCSELFRLGHAVRLAMAERPAQVFPFPSARLENSGVFKDLLRWCDAHVQMNVSLRFALDPLREARRKTVYIHGRTYAGGLAPMRRLIARKMTGVGLTPEISRALGCQHTIPHPDGIGAEQAARQYVDLFRSIGP